MMLFDDTLTQYVIRASAEHEWPMRTLYGHGQTRPCRVPLTHAEKLQRREKKQHKRRIRKLKGKK